MTVDPHGPYDDDGRCMTCGRTVVEQAAGEPCEIRVSFIGADYDDDDDDV